MWRSLNVFVRLYSSSVIFHFLDYIIFVHLNPHGVKFFKQYKSISQLLHAIAVFLYQMKDTSLKPFLKYRNIPNNVAENDCLGTASFILLRMQ